jgi:hypothetical protein
VQHVGTAEGDEESNDADHAELGYLVYQHPESSVQIAQKIHPLLSLMLVHPVLDPTLPRTQVLLRTGE